MLFTLTATEFSTVSACFALINDDLVVYVFQVVGASRLDKTEVLELAVDELRSVTYNQRRSCKFLAFVHLLAYNVHLSAVRK